MGDVNWGLGIAQTDPGQSFANAFETGLKSRQQQAQQLLQQHREGLIAAGKIIREISRQNPNMPHDQVYAMARQTAIQMGIPGADQAPPQFDEQYYTGILNAANALDPQAAGEGFTLSPGQVRYGGNGQMLAQGPEAHEPEKLIPYQQGGGVLRYDPATHSTQELVVPNEGGHAAGAPVGGEAPAEAVARLKANPHEAQQFDEIFGPGAAQKALGNGGQPVAPAGMFP